MHVALLEKQKNKHQTLYLCFKTRIQKVISALWGKRLLENIESDSTMSKKKKKHFLLYYKSKYILCMFKHSIAA